METTTDLGERYTRDDLEALCVTFEKNLNLYLDCANRLFDQMGGKDTEEGKVRIVHYVEHARAAEERAFTSGALVQDIAHVMYGEAANWCSRKEDYDGEWSPQHKRFVEQMERFLEMRKLVKSKLMRMLAELDDMEAMEMFANGKEL